MKEKRSMKTFTLRINVNNLRDEIEKDFFKFKDIFYKALIANLYAYDMFNSRILPNTIIEDSYYNQYLLFIISKNTTLREVINEIGFPYNTSIFLDMNLYIEEFINIKHNKNTLNLYSLTIDDTYHIVINNKQLKRRKGESNR